jgi:hypothetical protein
LLQQSCHSWKHQLMSSFGMSVRSAVVFCWIYSTDTKQWLLKSISSLKRKRKWYRPKSGEYGDWGIGGIWFFTKNYSTVTNIWHSTLSWYGIWQNFQNALNWYIWDANQFKHHRTLCHNYLNFNHIFTVPCHYWPATALLF